MTETKTVDGVVKVDLSEVIDNDLEGFLDILSNRLTGGPLLQDIYWKLVGFIGEGQDILLLEVSGFIEEENDA